MIDYTLPLEQLPDPLAIEPLEKPFDVTITPPGSKSITCRAYVLAALAEGESKIIRPLRADDTDRLLDALCTLGAEARWQGEDVFIRGVAGRFPRGGEVNLGDGGTPARFMIAVACLASEPVVVDGSPRMRERPIAEGVDMLRQLGATIEYVEEEGRLPVRVVPSDGFSGGELTIGQTASSQFASALMLIAPWLENGLELTYKSRPTSAQYLLLTYAVLCGFEAIQEEDEDATNVETDEIPCMISVSSKNVVGDTYVVEPDASSALYWYIASALQTGSKAMVPGIDVMSTQPDMLALWHLNRTALDIDFTDQLVDDTASTITTSGIDRISIEEFDACKFPDGALAIAALAAFADEPVHVTGLHTLRVKETDRLAALERELTRIGCTVSTTEDSITITPRSHGQDARATGDAATEPVVIETYNDHRMAMAFAVLGLARPGISIRNPKCVNKSYPGFWKDFAKLYQR